MVEGVRSRRSTSAIRSGEYAMGPVKFFDEAWYRRTSAWGDAQPVEPSSTVDGSEFVAEKCKKLAAAAEPSHPMNTAEADGHTCASG